MVEASNVSGGRKLPGPRREPGQPVGPEEVRLAVYEAAAKLFVEHGVDAVSLREVAQEAQVHHSLIGRYIGHRDVLIEQVYAHVTHQLVMEIDEAPLRARSFERESIMGRWTVLLCHFALRRELPAYDRVNPVEALSRGIQDHYGSDEGTARWRAAQVVGSAVGWRLLEPLLVSLGSLDERDLPEMRADLNLLHNIAGSLPLPTNDPRPPDQR